MGAGKTTLVKGLAGALGIKNITSPTFFLFRRYLLKLRRKKYPTNKKRVEWFVHADMYRVKDPREAILAGLGEYLADGRGLVVVEWGDMIKKILPARTLRLKMSIVDHGRKVTYPSRLGVPDNLRAEEAPAARSKSAGN